MSMIRWGVGLLILGVILSAIGFGAGGLIQYIGWILLAVGLILALIHLLGGAARSSH